MKKTKKKEREKPIIETEFFEPTTNELDLAQHVRLTALEIYYQWLADFNMNFSESRGPWIPTDSQMQTMVERNASWIMWGTWNGEA